jgi:serine O-acetyltransferase
MGVLRMNKVQGYIASKSDLREFLEAERVKYGRRNSRMPLFCIGERSYIWKHNVLLRRTEYYVNTGNRLMSLYYKVRLHRYQNKHQLHIPINTFDRGLHIMHLGPILVNSKVRGGKNITLHMNTSLVAGGTNDGTPQLGDGVVVGVGAVLLGDIKLANNIAVGANAVVNKSFEEENISIAGVPARKIGENGRLSWNRKNG